jgi:hypothetical protein
MGWPFSTEEYEFYTSTKYAWQFLSFAPKLHNEPVIIIDIRGNLGGNVHLGTLWLKLLTGEFIPHNFRHMGIFDRNELIADDSENAMYHARQFAEYFDIYELYEITFPEAFWLDENHFIFGSFPDRIVPNEQLIIFLTDRNTASAGESFADLAFNMENTLIIGQNTMGSLLTGTSFPSRITLPNCGMPFNLGRGFFVHPENHLTESIGLAPDIWVQGDALSATLAMLSVHLDAPS